MSTEISVVIKDVHPAMEVYSYQSHKYAIIIKSRLTPGWDVYVFLGSSYYRRYWNSKENAIDYATNVIQGVSE